MHRYRVVESVVFEYVWIVESEEPLTFAECKDRIDARGDGEAQTTREIGRTVESVKEERRPTTGGR